MLKEYHPEQLKLEISSQTEKVSLAEKSDIDLSLHCVCHWHLKQLLYYTYTFVYESKAFRFIACPLLVH